MKRRYKVGICGFGIAGGAIACFMARTGHEVTIFERATVVGPIGTGLLLQPSGQIVLQALGLLDEVAAQSEPITELRAFKRDNRTLVHLSYEEVAPGCRAYGVHRGTLFQALSDAVYRTDTRVLLNHEIVSWRVTSDGILAIDKDGCEHGTEGGAFDFLIAADGSRSIMRRTLEPDQAKNESAREYLYGAMWSVGRCTQVRGRLHQVVDGTRHLLGLLPIGAERCTLFWSLRSDQMAIVRERGFAAWRDEVVRLCPLAAEPLEEIGDFARVTFTTYRHTIMRRKYNERVVCLGDAAHAMSPHLGQGANLALLDAACLAASLERSESLHEAFRHYAQARRNHTLYNSMLSKVLTPFFQNDGTILGFGRDLALPLLCRFPLTRKLMERTVAGINLGFLGVQNDERTIPRQLTS